MLEESHDVGIKISNVSKRYPSGEVFIDVLKGIDLIARNNEILLITGPSGCGKTTLLSIIAGTLKFEEGDVSLFGTNIKELNTEELTQFRRKYVGFIFQQYHLLKALSVAQNVTIPLLLNGVKTSEALKQASSMLEKVGLKAKEHSRPSKLSGGEQQRVAIARALVHKPKVLICDEPTAALDAETGMRVMELLKEITVGKNQCTIIVTHDPRIYKYGDSIAHMEDGIITEYVRKEDGSVSS